MTTDEKISLSEVVGRGIKIKKKNFRMLYSICNTNKGGGREPLLRAETRRPDAGS